jgi:hypothetical protein
MSSYSVYAIRKKDTDEIVYIGSTTKTIQSRLREHYRDCKMPTGKYLREGGFDEVYIAHLFIAENSTHMLNVERDYIKQYQPILNRNK